MTINTVWQLVKFFTLLKKDFPYCLENIVTHFKYYSPADSNCDANDEDIEAENTEHDDDEQEGEVDSSK